MTTISVVLEQWSPTGGLSLAMQRIGSALDATGSAVRYVVMQGDAPAEVGAIRAGTDEAAVRACRGSDVIVTSAPRPDLLAAFGQVGHVIFAAQDLRGCCPAGSKHWIQLDRACSIDAGWRCALARPSLNCGGRRHSFDLEPLRRVRAMRQLLGRGGCSVLAPSASTAAWFERAGADPSRIAVVPNIGARPDRSDLERAVEAVPLDERGAVVYLGRLSHAKGAHLLPAIASTLGGAPFRAYSSGYLRDVISERLPDALRAEIDQTEVIARLSWARALVFPSMWPEPGGIAGLDAMLVGVPVGAFRVGSPEEWDLATLFEPGDAHAMGRWASAQLPPEVPRSVSQTIGAMDAYRAVVASQLRDVIDRLVSGRAIGPPDTEAQSDALRRAAGRGRD